MSGSRSQARHKAVQALYQYQLAGGSGSSICQQFLAEGLGRADEAYFETLVRRILRDREALDAQLDPAVSRGAAQLDPVEHAILWIGAHELQHELSVPYRVVLDEAIELAKRFGAPESHRLVNAVLDALGAQWREHERGRRA